jgi:hypothetical protein
MQLRYAAPSAVRKRSSDHLLKGIADGKKAKQPRVEPKEETCKEGPTRAGLPRG